MAAQERRNNDGINGRKTLENSLFSIAPSRHSDGLSNGSSNSESREPNFDSNIIVVMAVLICALICVTGLNSIVRCFLRCRRSSEIESPEDLPAQVLDRMTRRKFVGGIPTFVYGGASASKLPGAITDCPICLGDFVEGDTVRLLPKCNHGFHEICINKWLYLNSSCPTCRRSLLESTSKGSRWQKLAAYNRMGFQRGHMTANCGVQNVNVAGNLSDESSSGGNHSIIVSSQRVRREIESSPMFLEAGNGET